MKVNIIGNIFGSSGYAIHTRSLANALNEQSIDVKLDSPLVQGWERQVTDAELLMIQKEGVEDRTSIMIGQPPMWRYALADNPKHFIGFLVHEGDTIPEYWLEYLCDNKVDQIWVPSEHVKDAIMNTTKKEKELNLKLISDAHKYQDIKDKIKIVPHGVDLSLFKQEKEEEDRPFTFVCNKGWRGGMEDRGGVQYLLKAFTEEFEDKENVRLILKINPSYCPPEFNFIEEIEKIGITTKNRSKILLNIDNIHYSQIYKLYVNCDMFVCPTRCEGFNIPGLEAHAMGLPTIQTDFGGQKDYMERGSDFYLDYDLQYSNDPMYEGIKWATPNIEQLKDIMRKCYYNQELVKQMGKQAKKNVSKWTWAETSKKAKKFLKQLDL